MPIPLPYNFQNLNTSGLQDARDSAGDVIGKATPASYLDSNFNQLAQIATVSSTAPTPSYAGQLWLDTSVSPPVLKQWDGFAWLSNVDKVDGYDAGNASNNVAVSNGIVCTNLNADRTDGFHASQTPTANTIPVAGSTGKLDAGWLPAVGTLNMMDFDASGSWTVPSGVTRIMVVAIAGGGGGAGGAENYKGLGGYAGSAEIRIFAVVPNEVLTITVGAGGSAGPAGSSGGAGGNTVISGSASGSMLSLSGGPGGNASMLTETFATIGQPSMFGRGAPVTLAQGAGATGVSLGSGGGGGAYNRAGGAGRHGLVRIIILS